MPETFAVTQRGVGKPDYSKAVSSALERRGIKLGYNQTLKIFGLVFSNIASPYSWVFSPLATGSTAHFIDQSTGLATPFTVPQGYILFLIAGGESITEDVKLWGYLDGYLASTMGIMSSGIVHYENKIVGLSTEIIDPTGAAAHTVDVTVENIGNNGLEGGLDLIGILEAVGTSPLPATKTVRCKFCGYEETVPRETVQWICPKCEKLNLFYDFSRFKGTR